MAGNADGLVQVQLDTKHAPIPPEVLSAALRDGTSALSDTLKSLADAAPPIGMFATVPATKPEDVLRFKQANSMIQNDPHPTADMRNAKLETYGGVGYIYAANKRCYEGLWVRGCA